MTEPLAILGAFLSSAGLFGLIQFLISRHDTKKADLLSIKQELAQMREESRKESVKNQLATSRVQLFLLLATQPDNEDAIGATAQRYFIELGGNAEAWAPFSRWAKEHNVDTDWYKALLKRERSKNG